MSRLNDAYDFLKRVGSAAKEEYGHGKEDFRLAMKRGLEDAEMETDSTRTDQTLGTNRTFTMLRDLLGVSDIDQRNAREEMGIGLKSGRAEKIGQVLGTLGSDLTQDRSRGLWWLINAPQATANMMLDLALKKHAPNLFRSDDIYNEAGQLITGKEAKDAAVNVMAGLQEPNKASTLVSTTGRTKVGISRVSGEGKKPDTFRKRRYNPGEVEALGIPLGLTVNAAVGLMTPFGGQEGYKAVFESEEDPSKTSNMLGEVAAKYILGRTGNLLPWDEFKKVRPDVSKDEYMRYKAFKFDKEGDLNPLDGDLTVPTGVLKYTNEGIHGPEVQFLGRSLPLHTGVMPAAAAIAGTTYGARLGGTRGGLIGGALSTGASMLTGNLIEKERRRRNQEENERRYNS